jgi:hypothetical protein
MARPRKGPWRRGEKGHWYTTIGRENIKLADKSKSYEEAFDEYIKLLSCRENVRPDQLTINALFYRFLDWCEQHRSETTYNFYKRYLGSFEAFIRVRRVADLLPRHVEDWIDRRHDDCSDTTKNDLMKAVNRAINWGIEKRYLKHNPLAGMKRPSRSPRELVLTQAQFRQMISAMPRVIPPQRKVNCECGAKLGMSGFLLAFDRLQTGCCNGRVLWGHMRDQ